MYTKISASIIETYITVQKHQILHKKPSNIEEKIIGQLRSDKSIIITTIKLIPNFF